MTYVDDLVEMFELLYFEDTIKNAHVVFRSSNVRAQLNAILEGIGLGMVACFMAQTEPRLRVVLPEAIAVERAYWIMVHEDLRQVARVDAVCQFLTRILREDPALMMGD